MVYSNPCYPPSPVLSNSLTLNSYGTKFELRLRHQLTQSVVARDCSEWIRNRASFKTVTKAGVHNFDNFTLVENTDGDSFVYTNLQEFTSSGIGTERSDMIWTRINRLDAKGADVEEMMYQQHVDGFEDMWNSQELTVDVTDQVLEGLSVAYQENSPRLMYYITLNQIFGEDLKQISDDNQPNELLGFRNSKVWNLLFDFQKDAVLGIISKLEQFNGCILADSVGLGKTYTALAVIKYYEIRNKDVLVLCPKKLSDNWNTYKAKYRNNPIAEDRLRYDVLYHTDLSRKRGQSNGIDLSKLNWEAYDLIVIDESHNFRNGKGTNPSRVNRYTELMNKVIVPGARTRVLMLSATPVNNRFTDLKNQLALAYSGDSAQMDERLKLRRPLDEIFASAESVFNSWSHGKADDRTAKNLQKRLPFDFFELLDHVTIARSRRHIEEFYDASAIGHFPVREKPLALSPGLGDTEISFESIAKKLEDLNLSLYVPASFVKESCKHKYVREKDGWDGFFSQTVGRESGILRLMFINLLKRIESSVHAFRLTTERILFRLHHTLEAIEKYKNSRPSTLSKYRLSIGGDDLGEEEMFSVADDENLSDEDMEDDDDDVSTWFSGVRGKLRIKFGDMDLISWERDLREDEALLTELHQLATRVTEKNDAKLEALIRLIEDKIQNPFNPGNRKALIFTASADTAIYLYKQLSEYFLKRYGMNSALVYGKKGESTIRDIGNQINDILSCFSPISKSRDFLSPEFIGKDIDILVATDCISEGQNLQDCDFQINYDIHWNPVRLVQRFGRVDRIGSKNERIRMANFWPDGSLETYINLKDRVEARMKAMAITATGANPLEESQDLEYRNSQIRAFRNGDVQFDNVSNGVSITDLGFTDYKTDLQEFLKKHEELAQLPPGLHAVSVATDELPPGALFVMRYNGKEEVPDSRNTLHPFYLAYINRDGETVLPYSEPQKILDTLRKLCRPYEEPLVELCAAFNERTQDGRNMREFSELLDVAVDSIIGENKEYDNNSLFTPGGTTGVGSAMAGLQDFELLCFIAIEPKSPLP